MNVPMAESDSGAFTGSCCPTAVTASALIVLFQVKTKR
jgi:hypothetical protein